MQHLSQSLMWIANQHPGLPQTVSMRGDAGRQRFSTATVSRSQTDTIVGIYRDMIIERMLGDSGQLGGAARPLRVDVQSSGGTVPDRNPELSPEDRRFVRLVEAGG